VEKIITYLIRVVKYIVFLNIVFLIVTLIMSLMQGTDVNTLMAELPRRLLAPTMVAFIFPLFNRITTMEIPITGNKRDFMLDLEEVFDKFGMIRVDEQSNSWTYRMKSLWKKFNRVWEDTVIVNFQEDKVVMHGLAREMQRIEYYFLNIQKDKERI
jgi:hypothetical protein